MIEVVFFLLFLLIDAHECLLIGYYIEYLDQSVKSLKQFLVDNYSIEVILVVGDS